MRIISLVWHNVFPARFGGQKAVVCLLEHLGHHCDIICICSFNNEPPGNSSFQVRPLFQGGKGQLMNPIVWLRILQTVKKLRADVLWLEHPYHGLLAIVAKKIFKLRLIVHEHNIEFERFRQLKKWWWPLLKVLEKGVCRHSDLVLFKTATDETRAIEAFGLNRGQCLVVPYGVNFHFRTTISKNLVYARHEIPAGCKLLLFAGTLDYEPNAHAVKNIYEYIAPLLDPDEFRILICGRVKFRRYKYLSLLESPVVVMAGEVTEISEYFQAADVFLNPVMLGAGVQTKTFDALSFHLNVACFASTQNYELKQICPRKMFMAPQDDWAKMSEQIRLATAASSSTPDAFFNEYNWNSIVQKLAKVLYCRFKT